VLFRKHKETAGTGSVPDLHTARTGDIENRTIKNPVEKNG
jgi:hypothetical protein